MEQLLGLRIGMDTLIYCCINHAYRMSPEVIMEGDVTFAADVSQLCIFFLLTNID
jgi:hypothetical protein